MMKLTTAAWAALSCAAVATARPDDAKTKDDPAFRASIAKLGRLAYCDRGHAVAFCDLDGGNELTTQARGGFLKWLPDGRRVLACGGRVLVVDSRDGSVADLTADAPDDEFPANPPRISPDGRFAVFWHGPRRDNFPPAQTSYAVFDLDTGSRTDVGPLAPPSAAATWGRYDAPTAWWSPDGRLYAAIAAERHEGDGPMSHWRLVRWSPKDKSVETVAEVPPGTRITQMAFRRARFAYGVAPEQDFQFVPQVLGDDGTVLFELTARGMIWGLAWEADVAALRLRIQDAGPAPTTRFWRVLPGKPAVEIPEFEPPPRAPIGDGAAFVEERPAAGAADVAKRRRPVGPESELFRVNAATGEAVRIGPGRAPRRIGDVVVFWRVTKPAKAKEGPYFESPEVIPGTDDLWAYDPKDGTVIRLTDRGFDAPAWDIFATPGRK